MIPNIEALLAFARTVEGEKLKTLHRKKPFKVAVVDGTLEITPDSRKPRTVSREGIARILSRLEDTGSFRPGDYVDATFNASYILALVWLWQDRA